MSEVRLQQLQACLSLPVLTAEPMKLHTSFRIGGPADYFARPTCVEELQRLLAVAKELELPVTIIGRGSNLLVQDKGIRGLVIQISNSMSELEIKDTAMYCAAGVALAKAAQAAAKAGLTGLEFAAGIPGTMGGAVYMNAGAYDGEISRLVTAITAVDGFGNVVELTSADLNFSYRHSALMENKLMVVSVKLKLDLGQETAIRAKMEDFQLARKTKQPLEYPSAGSTFKRPAGYFAGTLIDQSGLKGYRVGDAQVSTKHAGFVVNLGEATCADVLQLISDVKAKVFQLHGVVLEPEVQIIGEA